MNPPQTSQVAQTAAATLAGQPATRHFEYIITGDYQVDLINGILGLINSRDADERQVLCALQYLVIRYQHSIAKAKEIQAAMNPFGAAGIPGAQISPRPPYSITTTSDGSALSALPTQLPQFHGQPYPLQTGP